MTGNINTGMLIFPILKDLNEADGILVKNEGIKTGFLDNGIEVDVLEFNSRGIFNRNDQVYTFHSGRYRRIYQYNTAVWEKIAVYILKKNYDFIWFRIPLINSSIAKFIRTLKENAPGCKIIIEYGAYPYVNELSGLKKMFYQLNRGNEKKAHGYADFVVTYCGQDRVDNLPNIPINNGIDLEHISIVNGQKNLSRRINFISVSSLKKWHAYERIIAGISLYLKTSGALHVHFNIVGNGPEYAKLVALTDELKLNDFITFHDFKTGKELDLIYEENDVAIGTLGFHRIGITNSSSLKNREYLARGLPIVLSTKDQDMPDGLPFVKYVPEGEEPVQIAELVKFAQEIYKRPKVNEAIRSYAEVHVSWKSKIKTVLTYLTDENIKSTQTIQTKIFS
jgi:hypothetical protein